MKTAVFILGNMQTNCYFLIDEKTYTCAVIDPADQFDRITEKLSQRGLKVDKILLTHAHFDHILALDRLREFTQAPLYMHRDDEELLLDPQKSLVSVYSKNPRPSLPAEHYVTDGEEFSVGSIKVRVMHTPGHTPGSVCYIAGDTIFSGDTIFRGSIGRYDFWGGDYDSIMKSLERIKSLDGDFKLCPGHGATTSLAYEKEHNFYLA